MLVDYQKLYNDLISYRKLNPIVESDIYLENHHIIPKCIGGSDDPSNMLLLTGSEHFTAHLLLSKMYPENKKLSTAIFLMSKNPRTGAHDLTSEEYEMLRVAHSRYMSEITTGVKKSPEHVEKIASGKRGKKLTREHVDKIASSRDGYVHSEETRNKISRAHKGRVKTAEHLNKILESREGFKHSEETKKLMSLKQKGSIRGNEARENIRRGNCSEYLIISPSGEEFIVDNGLEDWCADRMLSLQMLRVSAKLGGEPCKEPNYYRSDAAKYTVGFRCMKIESLNNEQHIK